MENMMKPEDKDKLNQCLDILDTTDLGLSLVWLWTWSTIKNIMEDDTYVMQKTEDEMWACLCEAVEAGQGFSLEYGAEQNYDDVVEWMLNRDYMVDSMFADEEDEDEDE
jgi:hypothetical protein